MSTTEPALTAHLVMPGGASDDFLGGLRPQLHDTFSIEHNTIQTERGEAACIRGTRREAAHHGRARRGVPEQACVKEASALLKAVADPTRLQPLSALAAAELGIHDLPLVAGVSESAARHQLRLLRAHRLVTARREDRTMFYQQADQRVTLLIGNAVEPAREG